MAECRYYDLCCFTDDSCNGEPECPKRDHCQFYSSMPDVKALLALAEELEEDACWEVQTPGDTRGAWRLKDACDRIREALGVER